MREKKDWKIASLKSIGPLIPIFTEYLAYMSRFFTIVHYDAWCAGAVKNLSRYTLADNWYAYVILESGAVIGFALVNGHLRFNNQGLAMAEFHIQKHQERKGLGRRLAEHIFDELPGPWEVAVSSNNHPALAFWETVVAAYTAGHFTPQKKDAFIGFVFNTASRP